MILDNPYYVDAIWLSTAFLTGLAMKKINQPSLIGFLLTGLILNLFGVTESNISSLLSILSDIGIMLLLFTIGLKIDIKSILQKEVLITSSLHMIVSVVFIGGIIFLFSYFGFSLFTDITLKSALLIGFALSFSSTVFVIKILEDRGEISSFHGKISIGILIVQDIIAVIFISISSGNLPSIWAIALIPYLFVVRFILFRLLSLSGHGELLTLFGFFSTLIAGALVFSIVGIKADLGALTIGILLAQHKKSKELYERMMSYKDFFLIAFFVSIGLIGIPTMKTIYIVLILSVFIHFKGVLYLVILSSFKIKARTNFLTSIILGNFSEFGLIVSAVGYQSNLISKDWMVIMALLLIFSFILSSPLNAYAHQIFDKYKKYILILNRNNYCIDDETISLGTSNYIIAGMGSIGLPAYKYYDSMGLDVVGIDYDRSIVETLQKKELNIFWGDTTNILFWEKADFSKIQMVVLAMSDFQSNYNTMIEISRIKDRKFSVGVICHYYDEIKKFKAIGADYIYDYKSNVGIDFAEQTVKFAERAGFEPAVL